MNINDEYYIKQTFELAQKAVGKVSPNPLVGAVIVKNGSIISSGFHERYGCAHAELNAILNSRHSIEGATLYCNLEPCCHTNKQTPPCAQRIIQQKIARVVIANRDPNPAVNGKGIEFLRKAGIQVTENVLEQEGSKINEIFFTAMKKNRPFIHLKWAQTLDGNIATINGDSKWISNKLALQKVHLLRHKYDAILVGKHTLLRDNPRLTVRLHETPEPRWRIILSSLDALKHERYVTHDTFRSKTILVTSLNDVANNKEQVALLKDLGIHIETVKAYEQDLLDLTEVCHALKKYAITSLLVEGGGSVLSSFYKKNLWDSISVFVAPMFFGKGIIPLLDLNITQVRKAKRIKTVEYEQVGDSIHCMLQNDRSTICLPD